MTSHDVMSPNPEAIVGCPNCGGSGWDDAFRSLCDCQAWFNRDGALRARLLNVRDDVAPRRSGDGTGHGTRQPVSNAASEKQLSFISKLIAERDPAHPWIVKASRLLGEGITKTKASQIIDALLTMPKSSPALGTITKVERHEHAVDGLDLSGMISGRYAVPGGDTRLKVESTSSPRASGPVGSSSGTPQSTATGSATARSVRGRPTVVGSSSSFVRSWRILVRRLLRTVGSSGRAGSAVVISKTPTASPAGSVRSARSGSELRRSLRASPPNAPGIAPPAPRPGSRVGHLSFSAWPSSRVSRGNTPPCLA